MFDNDLAEVIDNLIYVVFEGDGLFRYVMRKLPLKDSWTTK